MARDDGSMPTKVLDKHDPKLLPFVTALLLVITGSAFGAGPAWRQDAPEAAKRKMARAENFLLRTYEELDKAHEYQKAVIEGLEKRGWRRAAAVREFLDWQRNHAAWLKERLRESESDIENFYSHGMIRPGLAKRFSAMADDYTALTEQLTQMTRQLDEAQERNAAQIQKFARIIEYYDYTTEEAEKRRIHDEKWRPARQPPEDWLLHAKDLTNEEIKQMKQRIDLLQELQKEYDAVLELGEYEINWLSLKTGDSIALSAVASAVVGDSLGTVMAVSEKMLRQYESDISFLEKKLREIHVKRTSLARTGPGSMRTIDRKDELWDYYWTMKTRFEHHIEWLREQIGAYRADMVLVEKSANHGLNPGSGTPDK